jgi:hypothetical protein
MPELTESDLDVIARARKLADVAGPGTVLEHTGENDLGMAYAVAFGQATYLLAELADRLERLGGS